MRVLAVTAAALALAGVWCVGCGSGTAVTPPDGGSSYVISPQGDPLTLTAGQHVAFAATLTAAAGAEALLAEPVAKTWSVEGGIGTIDATTGAFDAVTTASSSNPKTGTIRVRSSAGTGSLRVTVGVSMAAISRIRIQYPSNVQIGALRPGQVVQFSAVGEDMFGNRSVGARLLISPTWSCSPELGTIDSRGRFTARTDQQSTQATGAITASLPGVGGLVTESLAGAVNFPPVMSLTPTTLVYGDSTTELTFQVLNGGSEALTWAASESLPWLTLSSTGGAAPATVTATVSRAGLSAGSAYAGTITVQGSDGRNAQVSVSMAVTAIDVDISSSTGGGSR